MNGIKRNLSKKITLLLQQFPAVVILGARQAGKTTLSRQVRPDWHYLDLENPDDFERLSYDPLFFLQQNPTNLIIDEAQSFPGIFPVLRGIIDADRRRKGRFLLTGSASPALLKNISETLAGRIAIVELGTLKANEVFQRPLSPFYRLFESKIDKEGLVTGESPLTLEQVRQAWLLGGYPEPVLSNDESFYRNWMDNYRATYIQRDLAQLFPRLNRQAYQRFLGTLGRLSGTVVNKRDLARAIEVSEGTVREYLAIAEGTFLWRNISSYEKNVTKSIIKMPKGYLRDSGLAHYLLRIRDYRDLVEHPVVGPSFETFVIEEIIKGLQASDVTNYQACYYRTRNGAEIDLVLDGVFGTLPIEVKYGSTIQRRQLQTMSRFLDEQGLELGLLINQSREAGWITRKIYQIPATWL